MPTEYRVSGLADRVVGASIVIVAVPGPLLGEERLEHEELRIDLGVFDVEVRETLVGRAGDRVLVRVPRAEGPDGQWIVPIEAGRPMVLFLAADPASSDGPTYSPVFAGGYVVEGDDVIGLPPDLQRELGAPRGRTSLDILRRAITQINNEYERRRRETEEMLGRDNLDRPYPEIAEAGELREPEPARALEEGAISGPADVRFEEPPRR
jgi:hypothetical protein